MGAAAVIRFSFFLYFDICFALSDDDDDGHDGNGCDDEDEGSDDGGRQPTTNGTEMQPPSGGKNECPCECYRFGPLMPAEMQAATDDSYYQRCECVMCGPRTVKGGEEEKSLSCTEHTRCRMWVRLSDQMIADRSQGYTAVFCTVCEKHRSRATAAVAKTGKNGSVLL